MILAVREEKIKRLEEEFKRSGIPADLWEVNVAVVEGLELLEILAGAGIQAIQGRQGYLNRRARRIWERYEEVARDGGWAAWGTTVSGKMGSVPIVKPFRPRTDERGRVIKYETPERCPSTPLLPRIPEKYLRKIESRWGVKLRGDEPEWQEILRNPSVPVGITEGFKKACSLVAQGLPTIAIRGITQWHSKGSKEVYPEIRQFCDGRPIYIVFDQDTKLSTLKDVNTQALKLGRALAGDPKFLVWEGEAKGIDDYLGTVEESYREEALSKLLENSISLKEIKERRNAVISKLFLNRIKEENKRWFQLQKQSRISGLDLPTGKILALSAPVGSGKTTEIVRVAKEWQAEKKGYIIVLSPRNALGKQIAQKIGIPHIHDYLENKDLRIAIKSCKGVALCPDSLHRIPENVWESKENLLILDEANQVISHILNGDTLGERWISHNKLFQKCLEESLGIIAAEANLPHYCLSFLKEASGKPISAFQYEGDPSLPKMNCYLYDLAPGERESFDNLLIQTGRERRIIVVSTSRIYLEILERIFSNSGRKVVRIDSETNEAGNFSDFFADPDKWIKEKQPQVLLLSPSAESGLSIQANVRVEEAYFEEVWGYFPTLCPETGLQLLGRYRPAVARHIFCPKQVFTTHLEKNSAAAVKKRLNEIAAFYRNAYRIDKEEPEDQYQLSYERYFSMRKAVTFHRKKHYQAELKNLLEEQGHRVFLIKPEKKKEKNKETKEIFKMLKEEILREKAKTFAETTIEEKHTVEWAKRVLETKESSKKERTRALKVLKVERFPSLKKELNEENFVYYSYYKKYGALDKQAEMRALSEVGESCLVLEKDSSKKILGGKERIRPKHQLRTRVLGGLLINKIKLLSLVDLEYYDNEHPIVQEIRQKALEFSKEIWELLRLDINPQQTGVQIVNKLLRRIGLKGVIVQQGRKGNQRPRRYRVEENTDKDTEEQEIYRQLLSAWREYISRQIESHKSPDEEKDPQPSHSTKTDPKVEQGSQSLSWNPEDRTASHPDSDILPPLMLGIQRGLPEVRYQSKNPL